MGFAVAIGFLLLCIIEYTIHRAWTAPSVLFCGYWAFISWLAALRLYNINSVSLKTWLVIIIGVLSFVCGTKIIIRVNKKRAFNIQADQPVSDSDCFMPQKVYWLLFIIVGISVTQELIQAIRLLSMNVSLGEIRGASFGITEVEGYEYSNSYFAYFVRRIISALEMILIATGIDLFFRNTKKNIIYIIAAIYLTIAAAFSTGGRWIIVFFAVMVICRQNILLSHASILKSFNLSHKKIKVMLLATMIMAVAIYAFSRVSIARLGENADFGKSFYYYICGCVPFLDIKINEIDQTGIYSFFFAGQYGLWSYIIPVLSRLTGLDLPIYSQTVEMVMNAQQTRHIGGGIYFNAFTTSFYYLYADFRFLGIFLGMFVYGIVAGTLYKKAKTTGNPFAVVPYLVIMATIVQSLHTYWLVSADNVFAFLIMIVIYIFSKYKFKIK